jgi:hypothetical protein
MLAFQLQQEQQQCTHIITFTFTVWKFCEKYSRLSLGLFRKTGTIPPPQLLKKKNKPPKPSFILVPNSESFVIFLSWCVTPFTWNLAGHINELQEGKDDSLLFPSRQPFSSVLNHEPQLKSKKYKLTFKTSKPNINDSNYINVLSPK